jgi:hypothetical protein
MIKDGTQISLKLVTFSLVHILLFLVLFFSSSHIFVIVPPLFSFNYMILSISIISTTLTLFHILEIYEISSFWPLEQLGKNLVFVLFLSTVLVGRWPFGFEN